MRRHLISRAQALVVAKSDSWYPYRNRNRFEHIGAVQPIGEEDLEAAIGLYRDAGVPRFFAYVPLGAVEALHDAMDDLGFRLGDEQITFVATPKELGDLPAGIRIERAGREHLLDLTRVLTGHGTQTLRDRSFTVDLLGTDQVYTLILYVNDVPAATGTLFVHQRLGRLGFATTAPEFRNRGLYQLLIRARLAVAKQLNCEIASAPVFHNFEEAIRVLKATGFKEACRTSVYRYEADTDLRGNLAHTTEGHPVPYQEPTPPTEPEDEAEDD